MEKQLMWISGLVKKELTESIKLTCIQANKTLQLSDRFFRFPLHISLKRTFYTDKFEQVKTDLIDILKDNDKVVISGMRPYLNRDMLWLLIDDNEELLRLHNRIDLFLKDKYQIEIDEFDRNYVPHVTLFRSEDEDRLKKMYECLCELSLQDGFVLNIFAIGTSLENNEFISI